MAFARLDKLKVKQFVDQFDTFLLDCDGVLWHGNTAIKGAIEGIRYLKDQGKRVFLVTNNSTKSREQYLIKCQQLGFPVETKEDIVTTSYLVSEYAERNLSKNNKIYVIGSDGIGEGLTRAGFDHFGIGPDEYGSYNSTSIQLTSIKLEQNVKAVIFGFDPFFSYPKLMKAASYLQDPDCKFIVSNTDDTFPTDSQLYASPGTGSLLKALIATSDRTPTVLGKPHRFMFEHLESKFGIVKEKTLMVGDRCDTDIKFGHDNGMQTLFVKTGISTVDQINKFIEQGKTDLVPDYFTDSFGDLVGL